MGTVVTSEAFEDDGDVANEGTRDHILIHSGSQNRISAQGYSTVVSGAFLRSY